MITRFRIKNFRSIADMELSMTYDEGKAPKGHKEMSTWPFLSDKTGRYVPCLAIYGANASGKTNIIRAMGLITDILANGIQHVYLPNDLHPELKEIELEIECTFLDDLISWKIAYDKTTIKRESLIVNGAEIFSIGKANTSFKALTQEEYTEERLRKIYEVECCTANDRSQLFSFLGKMGLNYQGLNPLLTKSHLALRGFILVFLNNTITPSAAFEAIDRILGDKEQQNLYDQVAELLQKLDLGIHRMDRQCVRQANEELPSLVKNFGAMSSSTHPCEKDVRVDIIHTWHRDVEGNEVRFNLKEESQGTFLLVGLLSMILVTLKMGSTLVIDEIDRSLHPLLQREIIRLFKDKTYNTNNAQLIFTTHTTDLIDDDLLRVSEVAIVNKTLKKGTTLKRLSEFEDIRNVTNFRKRYLQGNFRGIPYPYI